MQSRYISLQYELLVELESGSGVLAQVSMLQSHFEKNKDEPLTVESLELSWEEFVARFSPFLPVNPQSGIFHVFISYRHGGDSDHTAAFYNALTTMPLGGSGDHMSIFYDCESLREGAQFDVAFMKGLRSTLVMVPFVTTNSLSRMADESNVTALDNVLLEWLLAITLHKMDAQGVYLIIPIFCGEIKDDSFGRPDVQNLFQTFKESKLPDVVNQPTLDRANQFLEDELKLGRVALPLTVRQIYAEMKKFNTSSTRCWDIYAKSAHGAKAGKGAITVDERVALDSAKQRLFARCAAPVRAEVEKVISQRKKDIKAAKKPKVDGRAGIVTADAEDEVLTVNMWTVNQVAEWLRANGMERHTAKFVSNEISGDVLVELALDDLVSDVGLKPIHAKTVLRKRDKLISVVGAGADDLE